MGQGPGDYTRNRNWAGVVPSETLRAYRERLPRPLVFPPQAPEEKPQPQQQPPHKKKRQDAGHPRELSRERIDAGQAFLKNLDPRLRKTRTQAAEQVMDHLRLRRTKKRRESIRRTVLRWIVGPIWAELPLTAASSGHELDPRP